jgi:hypothetical protein
MRPHAIASLTLHLLAQECRGAIADAKERASAGLANAAVWYLRKCVLATPEERANLAALLAGELGEAFADAFDAGQQALARELRAAIARDERIHPGATETVLALLEEIIATPLAQQPLKHAADDLRQRLWVAIFDAASEPNDGQEALDRIVDAALAVFAAHSVTTR